MSNLSRFYCLPQVPDCPIAEVTPDGDVFGHGVTGPYAFGLIFHWDKDNVYTRQPEMWTELLEVSK